MTPPIRLRVDLAVEDYRCDLQVNGVPIVRNYGGDRIDVTVPVTQFVATGSNRLSMDVFVDGSYGIRPRARAVLQAAPPAEESWTDIAAIMIEGPIDRDMATSDPGASRIGSVGPLTVDIDAGTQIATIGRAFECQLQMPRWAWLGSQAVALDSPALTSLPPVYERLHALLAAARGAGGEGALRQLEAMLGELTSELGAAFGMEPTEVFEQLDIRETLADPRAVLDVLPLAGAAPELAAGGRLARLFPAHRDDMLMFRLGDGLVQAFDFWFRFDGQAWRPTR